MTWFKVDDSFHSHPKVLAAEPAALGLWVVAGSWSSANLTEGFVPDHVLPRLLPDAETLALSLITAGLWRRKKGGYQFHDWLDRNPSKKAVENDRAGKAARQKRWRENQRRRATDASSNGVTNTAPAPTRPEGSGSGKARPGASARASPPGAHDAPPEGAAPVEYHPYKPDPNGTCELCGMPERNRRHQDPT